MSRVDTHHHVVPPEYAAWLRRKGTEAGGLPIPDWRSSQAALALMDERGVETAILSVSTPGVHLGDDAEARAMARHVNEYAAEMGHAMHQQDPKLFAATVVEWAAKLS